MIISLANRRLDKILQSVSCIIFAEEKNFLQITFLEGIGKDNLDDFIRHFHIALNDEENVYFSKSIVVLSKESSSKQITLMLPKNLPVKKGDTARVYLISSRGRKFKLQ
jgi:hypothetical protein